MFAGRALLGSMVAIFISTVALALFAVTASWGLTINSVLLFIAGAFNCGPDTILGKYPVPLNQGYESTYELLFQPGALFTKSL